MTLRTGTRLGPYEIQRLIGSGGMGEVYRAVDTRLHRPVAIKVLTEELISSTAALERFQREAQTASLLNHPNICTIYDVGNAPPLFIAMELLEGESLQQRLLRGRLDLQSLVIIAIGTAEGLDAAHSRGFIHRDIKPANIFLTPHGPKLLDFGLAKTRGATTAEGISGIATSPDTAPFTESGVTIGTIAYMSPEQLRGNDIDARSDLFSFGIVLYEMATGRRAFEGKTSAEISAAILYQPPRPPFELVPEIPTRLSDIVLQSLEKDREDRCQTAADLRADLRRLKREIESQSTHSTAALAGTRHPTGATVSTQSLTQGTRFDRIRQHPVAFGLSAVVLVGALAGALFYLRSGFDGFSGTPSLISLENVQVSRLTRTGDAERPAAAPDGNYLAFIRRQNGQESLHVRQTATAAVAEVVNAEPNVSLWGATISPDSGYIDYIRRAQGQAFELWRVPFLGGVARRLLDRVNSPIGWAPDGRRFAFVRADTSRGTTAIVVVDADTSNERVLAERQRPAQFVSLMIATRPSIAPTWSPDGRLLAIPGAGASGNPSGGDVAFIDVTTGELRTIPLPSSAVRGLVWFDQGTLLLNAANPGGPLQLHQLSYPSGRLNPLTRDVNDYDGISLAADGRTLICARRERQTDLVIVDATGRTVTSEPITVALDQLNWVGPRILYDEWGWTPGSSPQQLLRDGTTTSGTLDGRTLVFRREDSGLWKANAEGGPPSILVAGEAFHPSVTPDDQSVIFLSARAGQQSPWIVPLNGGEPKQLFNRFVAGPGIDLSPDGKSLVFLSRDEQQNRAVAVVCDLPDCSRPTQLALASQRVRWTPDARAITYIEASAQTNLWTVPIAGGAASQLTHFEDRTIVDFDWSPDGKQLAVARRLQTNDIVLLRGLRRE